MKNKIYIGMFRPKLEDLKSRLMEKDLFYFYCSCFSNPQISGIDYGYLVNHWLQGHFDEPIYKEICEHHWSELQKELVNSWAVSDDSLTPIVSVKFYYQSCSKCGEIKILR